MYQRIELKNEMSLKLKNGSVTDNVSMADKAQMINALTNTMDVNRSKLGGYDRLQTISLEKLTKIIESIDV